MKWFLFLDDERTTTQIFGEYHRKMPVEVKNLPIFVAKNVDEAIEATTKLGCPSFVSFDNDLGYHIPEGVDFAKWLIDAWIDERIELPTDFAFNVHTANVAAAVRIESLMSGYLRCARKE